MSATQLVPTTMRPRKGRPQSHPLPRADLPLVELGCLLSAPSRDLLGRRCLSEQLPGVSGSALPPILVIVNEDLPIAEQRRLYVRAVADRRRGRCANDTAGSSVVYLAAHGGRRAGGAS